MSHRPKPSRRTRNHKLTLGQVTAMLVAVPVAVLGMGMMAKDLVFDPVVNLVQKKANLVMKADSRKAIVHLKESGFQKAAKFATQAMDDGANGVEISTSINNDGRPVVHVRALEYGFHGSINPLHFGKPVLTENSASGCHADSFNQDGGATIHVSPNSIQARGMKYPTPTMGL